MTDDLEARAQLVAESIDYEDMRTEDVGKLIAALVAALEACYSALMNETSVGVRSAEKKQAALILALAQERSAP